jgi:hypothetical protein
MVAKRVKGEERGEKKLEKGVGPKISCDPIVAKRVKWEDRRRKKVWD